MKSRNRWAALVLVVLAPVVAELTWGTTPISQAWVALFVLPMYGGGALLVRELVRRTGRGWPSILVLGLAYEIVEDGIGLQALTSPTLYGAAEWGPRILGFNLTYWVGNATYHVIFSMVIPILLVELLFPAHWDRPFVGRVGLVGAGVLTVFGVALVRLFIPPTADPGYTAPLPFVIGCLVVVAGLAVVALRVIPRRRPSPHLPHPVPAPWMLAVGGVVVTVVLLGLIFPVGPGGGPAFTPGGAWAVLPMAGAIAVLLVGGSLIRHWARSAGWTDRHALLLAGGALVGHTTFGVLALAHSDVDRRGLAIIAVLTALAVWAMVGRLRRAAKAH